MENIGHRHINLKLSKYILYSPIAYVPDDIKYQTDNV